MKELNVRTGRSQSDTTIGKYAYGKNITYEM